MNGLPIESALPDLLREASETPNLVLAAPPGAGKTTGVPPALLSCSWTQGRRILLLQPRRLAARAAAARIAAVLGEPVGETAGYRVRLERKVGPRTRIECVTTGLFLRQLQSDPELSGVAAILFDEFHERSLDADLALALSLEAQSGLRPDLRLIVMSATLDTARTAALLPGARVVASEGRAFPVETRHLGDAPVTTRIEDRVAKAILRTVSDEDGDVLVFLPGLGEIRRVKASLESELPAERFALLMLHGDLPLAEQDLALRADAKGRRKIVLATSIAETSLTIDGIRVVIDAGLKRLPRFDPVSGMTRLETVRVSLAAADQRRGRAGRTAPGICYRLWSEASERALAPFDAPEILAADLAPFALELGAWGTTDPGSLALLDAPPEAHLAQARDLLQRLGALDSANRATPHGKAMVELGTHPRLAHMMIRAGAQGRGALAADLAALLSERDLVRDGRGNADLRHRLDLLREGGANGRDGDRGARERIRRSAEAWRKQLSAANATGDRNTVGAVTALAYPDRIAQRRGGDGQYRLANGKGARLDAADPLAREDWLAIAALDGDRREARIFLAAPLTLAEIEEDFTDQIVERESVSWNARLEQVDAKRERRLWSLVLEERPLGAPSKDAVLAAMLDGIRQMGLDALPWSPAAASLRARIAFLRKAEGEAWPDLSDAALLDTLDAWLAPYLDGISRRAHLTRLDLHETLSARLDWKQRQALDALAPTHLTVPSGSRVPLDYAAPVPVLAVRLQEMFGAAETPKIAGGKIPVLLHLLSPARRPVQVTQDLRSFWTNVYAAVRADLRGQYPKHYWPDDPLQAEPTARAKPRPR
jgi:ATP-dependent helicase HrpB